MKIKIWDDEERIMAKAKGTSDELDRFWEQIRKKMR